MMLSNPSSAAFGKTVNAVMHCSIRRRIKSVIYGNPTNAVKDNARQRSTLWLSSARDARTPVAIVGCSTRVGVL
jgi:hypothetical protein